MTSRLAAHIAHPNTSRTDPNADPTSIDTLLFDGLPLLALTAHDQSFLAPFTRVTTLSLTSCHLASLANLPQLPHLQRLDLADNHLPDHSLPPLLTFKLTLRTLSVSHNLLRSLETLATLGGMHALRDLEVQGNPVCQAVRFREEVFALLLGLEVLDGEDAEGEEVAGEEEGEGEEYDMGERADGGEVCSGDDVGSDGQSGEEENEDES
jgi:hypothetical protein